MEHMFEYSLLNQEYTRFCKDIKQIKQNLDKKITPKNKSITKHYLVCSIKICMQVIGTCLRGALLFAAIQYRPCFFKPLSTIWDTRNDRQRRSVCCEHSG